MHHSKKTTQFLLENGIEVIFNVAYAPEYNPIERVWAQLKALFKKEKMGLILEGAPPTTRRSSDASCKTSQPRRSPASARGP